MSDGKYWERFVFPLRIPLKQNLQEECNEIYQVAQW